MKKHGWGKHMMAVGAWTCLRWSSWGFLEATLLASRFHSTFLRWDACGCLREAVSVWRTGRCWPWLIEFITACCQGKALVASLWYISSINWMILFGNYSGGLRWVVRWGCWYVPSSLIWCCKCLHHCILLQAHYSAVTIQFKVCSWRLHSCLQFSLFFLYQIWIVRVSNLKACTSLCRTHTNKKHCSSHGGSNWMLLYNRPVRLRVEVSKW